MIGAIIVAALVGFFSRRHRWGFWTGFTMNMVLAVVGIALGVTGGSADALIFLLFWSTVGGLIAGAAGYLAAALRIQLTRKPLAAP